MGDGVRTLQATEVIGWRTFWKAIGIAGRDIQGIQHSKPVFQVRHSRRQRFGDEGRQIPKRATQAMPPTLLTVMEMQSLQGFFNRLV